MKNLLERINERLRGAVPRRAIASLLVAAECFSVAAVGVPRTYAEDEGIAAVSDQAEDYVYPEEWSPEDAIGDLELWTDPEETAEDAVSPAEAAELGAQAAEQAAYEAELAAYDAAMAAYDAEVSLEDLSAAEDAAARADEAARRAEEAARRAADEADWTLEAYYLAEQEAQKAADEATSAAEAAEDAACELEELVSGLKKTDDKQAEDEKSEKNADAKTDGKTDEKIVKTTQSPAPDQAVKPSAKPEKEIPDRNVKADGDKTEKPADKNADQTEDKNKEEAEKKAEIESARELAETLAAEADEKAALAAYADEEAERAWAAADRAAEAAKRAAAAVESAFEASARAAEAARRAADYQAEKEREALAAIIEEPDHAGDELVTEIEPEDENNAGPENEQSAETRDEQSAETRDEQSAETKDVQSAETRDENETEAGREEEKKDEDRREERSDTTVTVAGELPEGVEIETLDVAGDYQDFNPDAFRRFFLSDLETFASDGTGSSRSERREYAVLAAYDITLTLDGEEYQPEEGRPLEVSITVPEIPEGKELQVWHILDDGSAEQIEDFTVEDGTVSFAAPGFSVYVVVQVTKEEIITASDGNEYLVRVTYDSASGIPAEAELCVSELRPDDAGYAEYVAASAEKLGQRAEDLALARPFDIKLRDPATGVEYQPAGDVKVSVQLLREELDQYANIGVVHFHGEAGAEAEVLAASLDGEAVVFETDGFSVFVVCGYTVDFHWEGYTYSIAGKDSILLSELLAALRIEDFTLADVANAAFSDPTLVRVEEYYPEGIIEEVPEEDIVALDEGAAEDTAEQKQAVRDWLLTSLAPFDTNETLTLTLSDGRSVEIRVTDAQPVGEDWNEYTIPANAIHSGDDNMLYWKVVDGCLYIHCDADIEEGRNISGANYNANYGSDRQPWDGSKDTITSAVVTGNMSRIFCSMFRYLPKLTSVSFSCPNIQSIESGAFQDAMSEGTQSVTLDFSSFTNLTAIKSNAFYNCYKVENLNFSGCTSLSTIENQAFKQDRHKTFKSLNFSGCTSLNNIDANAFPDCYNITTIDLTNTAITSLTGLPLNPSNLETLNLSGCNSLTEVDLTKNESNNPAVFSGLRNLTLPNSVTSFHTSANHLASLVLEGSEADWANRPDVALPTSQNPAYTITYTVKTPVTVTMVDVTKIYGDEDPVFTATVTGLINREDASVITYTSIASGSGTAAGRYPVTFTNVTPNETLDTTGNYLVTETVDGTLNIEKLVEKELISLEGSWARWKIQVNKEGFKLNDGEPLTLTDNFNPLKDANGKTIETQTIDYASIVVNGVTSYDYRGSTGTFIIPDASPATIIYRTRVKAQPGDVVEFGNVAQLLDSGSNVIDEYECNERCVIYPSASDVTGNTGEYMVKLYVYGDPNMQTGIGGAQFILLDANQRPITYRTGTNAGVGVTFTTKENGYVEVPSEPDLDEFSIEKNTSYYLEMIRAPRGYKKDSTLYNFMITDDPGYDSGGVWTYYNGDTMKVRLFPEEASLNVSVRFSGNYALTEEQQNSINIVLQRQNGNTWEELERHSYSEFSYGLKIFDNGQEGQPFKPGETYRVIEKKELWDLPATIHADTTHYLIIGSEKSTNSNLPLPFTVSEDNQHSSFNVVINNEYEEPKLTITKMDKETGARLSGADFTVRKAADDAYVTTYTTLADGTVVISGGADYESETLYYAVETVAPTGYLLPMEPEKVYFYFCNDPEMEGEILAQLPEGETAVNLSETFDSLTIHNQKEKLTIPVMKTWQGNTWPSNVTNVVIGLYQTVNGVGPEKVTTGTNQQHMTVTLTPSAPYNNKAFTDLPARDEHGLAIIYSIQEESVNTEDGTNIIGSYVQERGISDSGIYIVRNKPATGLTVIKEWYDGEQKVTDPAVLATQSNVTFDVYRTTERLGGVVTAENMEAVVGTMTNVRSDLSLTNEIGWRTPVTDLDKHDDSGSDYYYYVLETVPNFGDEVYVPDEEHNSITIRNQIAPKTVTLTVKLDELKEDLREESKDTEFWFTLALKKGSHPIRHYQVAEGYITDWDGEVRFNLKEKQSIPLALPAGVTATVTEDWNIEYVEEASSTDLTDLDSEDGRVFCYDVTEETDQGVITFTNTLRAVCKVGEKPFESLGSALRYIRDSINGLNGPATIEMLEDYPIPTTDIFSVQEDEHITLTTASTDPGQAFYFKTGRTGEYADTAIITRGGVGGSMLTNGGTLTLDKIVLDGASIQLTVDGGLVSNAGTLNLSTDTVLRNSSTEGRGGAIYNTGTIKMPDGVITGSTAARGSAIYMADGELNMTGGVISGNIGDRGAVTAENAVVRVNLSETPWIYGNVSNEGAASNLYIGVDSNKVIEVINAGLTAGAKIGVTAEEGHREIGEQFAYTDVSATGNLDCFINDESDYKGKLKDGTTSSVVWDGLTMTLNKIVSPVGANPNDTFTITLRSSAIKKSRYTIDGNLDNTVTAARRNTPGSIELRNVKAGDVIVISPLGAGEYTIEEEASNYSPAYSFQIESAEVTTNTNGVFDFRGSGVATVTNTRRLATVELSKTMHDPLAGADPVGFHFTVKLTEADGTPVKNYALADGIATDNSGIATFTATPTNAQAFALTCSVPVGAKMEITEDDNPAYTITATSTNVADTDAAANVFAFTVTDDGAAVSFHNERKMAKVVLRKELEGKVSAVESFDFTVTLIRENDGGPAANYPLYDNITTDGYGRASIRFSFGRDDNTAKSVTLTIPEGAKLTVAEDVVKKNVNGAQKEIYNTRITVNGSEKQYVDEPVVTIDSVEADKNIVFTNARKLQTITVTNSVSGYSGNVVPFSFTAVVTDYPDATETDLQKDYDANGFTDGVQTFELTGGQTPRQLTVPYGANIKITQSFITGYKTTIKHGDDSEIVAREDAFDVLNDVTVAFTNTQLISMVLVNNCSSDFENVVVTVGKNSLYGTEMFRVIDDDGDGIGDRDEAVETFNPSTKQAVLNIGAGETVILGVNHQDSVTAEQGYTVKFNTPEDGYYYTITNEPSFHQFADPAVMRVYNAGSDFMVNGKLRYSVSDSTVTFTAQPLVSYDVNGGAWTTEMEGYYWNGDLKVYQYAVNTGGRAPKPDPDPIYPTAEDILLLGWTTNTNIATATNHADDNVNFTGRYDFSTETNVVNAPLTLYAVWKKDMSETHTVTVKNGFHEDLAATATLLTNAGSPATGCALTGTLTTDVNGEAGFSIAAGETINLRIPDGAKLVLTLGVDALGISEQFTDGDASSRSFTINAVIRDGTVAFTPGVCKITDAAGAVLYDGTGKPAVYGTLQAAFTAYNGTLYTDAAHTIEAAGENVQAFVKMLVDEYAITSKHTFPTKNVILTTAGKDDESFPYAGIRDRATLYRDAGYAADCLFTHQQYATVVTLTNLIMDGSNVAVDKSKNGSLIYISKAGAELKITDGTIFRNVVYNGYNNVNGARGAIYVNNGKLTVDAGLFSNLHARCGGAICAETDAQLIIEGKNGKTYFEDCYSDNGGNGGDHEGGGAIYYSSTKKDLMINGGNDKNNPGIIFNSCAALGGNGDGGAIYITTNYSKQATIKGCKFERCSAKGTSGGDSTGDGGGAIDAFKVAAFEVSSCTFLDCDSQRCGGAIVALVVKNGRISIQQCTFDRCNCRAQGGALGAYSDSNKNTTLLEVRHSSFNNCSAGTEKGSGGAIQCHSVPCMDFESSVFADCWAGREGGAVSCYFGVSYQDSSWPNTYTKLTDCEFYRCRAEDRDDPTGLVHYGGAVNTKAKTVEVTGSYFEDCVSTLKEGGALHLGGQGGDSKATVKYSTFTNCSAKNGGGALLSSHETLMIDGCYFYGCASSASNGGAVYHYRNSRADSTQALTTITNCVFSADPEGGEDAQSCSAATNGGAIWTRATTVTIKGCTIDGCMASGNGGGVYLDTKTTTAKLTGGSITKCQAVSGSAVYVGKSATFSGITVGGAETDGNVCSTINSGAIHGGTLYFEGSTRVENNTCIADSAYDHDVLLQNDYNTTIYTTSVGLGREARIGVYTTTGKPYNNHGKEGQPFGTYDSSANGSENLEGFFNDRRDPGKEELVGYQASASDFLIYWGSYLCKITDAEGNTLKRSNGRPAVYQRLSAALDEFTSVTNDDGETGKAVYIKMLVENYPVKQDAAISNFPDADVTITTAGKNDADNKYRGADGTVCTIYRTDSKNNALFSLSNAAATLQFENITLDGRINKTGTRGSYRLVEASNGSLIVNDGTTMQYGTAGNNGGGAIYATGNALVTVNGKYDAVKNDATVQFINCALNVNASGKQANGGAIKAKNLIITCSANELGKYGTKFVNCSALRGGAACVNGPAMTIAGVICRDCHSYSTGGAFYHDNTSTAEGAITSISYSRMENCGADTDASWACGGAVSTNVGTLMVDTCYFKDCAALCNGGAICHGADGNDGNNCVSTQIRNTTFDGCSTTGNSNTKGYGGSIATRAKTVQIDNCTIKDSTSTNHGGALYCQNNAAGTSAAISGTVFERCSTTRETDGAGGAIWSNVKSLTLQDAANGEKTEISNCTAPDKSGAVYMETANSTLNIKGETLISSCFAKYGGAIYLKSGVTMNLTESPEFTKNGRGALNGVKVTDGACIYLAEGGTLNLSGSPNFSLNNLTDVSRVTNGGITDYVRQDVYLEGYSGKTAASIHVVGELTGDTIWIWPEKAPHRMPSEQFAKTVAGVSEASLNLLRNALADGSSGTGCTNGEYLAGVRIGSNIENVYWSKMYNIMFQKKDNMDGEVTGAEFTIYSDSACTAAVSSAVSADGDTDKDAYGDILKKGMVDFASIPMGVYYMKETATPTSYRPDDTSYLVLVGTPALQLSISYQEHWNTGILTVNDDTRNLIQRSTINTGKYYGIFKIKENRKADLSANLASADVGVLNIRDGFRAFFMKKDGSGAALPGAEFTLYKQTVTDGVPQTYENGYPKLTLWKHDSDAEYPEPVASADGTARFKDLSGNTLPKGLVYYPELPAGTYYLVESYYPERNGSNRRVFFLEDDRVFRLTILGEDDFTLEKWQPDGSYAACGVERCTIGNTEVDCYVIANTEVVCKLTDENDILLYERGIDGETLHPAIYPTLEEGFAAAQTHALYDADGNPVADSALNPALKLKALKDFTLSSPVTYSSPRALTFTTAERTASSDKDRYIFVTTRTTDASRAEIKRNYDEDTSGDANTGGLITVRDGASLTLQNINLNGQKANGRAVHVTGTNSNLTILNDTMIQSFKQTAEPPSTDDNDVKGGAICLEENTRLTVDGGAAHRTAVFQNNEVRNYRTAGSTGADGGAIAIGKECTVSLTNAQFLDNVASAATAKKGNGGAVSMNKTLGQEEQAKLPLENVVFRNNSASYQGGALRVSENSYLTVLNSIFTDNKANTAGSADSPGDGGAIAVLSKDNKESVHAMSELTITGGSFTGNSAANGGAVKIGGYGRLTINGSPTLSGNTASNTGGAVCAASNAAVTINSGTIRNNSARTGDGTACGGGIYLASNSTLTMSGGTISNNSSDCGGGIYAKGSTDGTAESTVSVSITGGTISDNTATNNGGGLYLGDGRKLYMANATLSRNSATAETAQDMGTGEHNGSGGGVYLRPKTDAELQTCTLNANNAYRAGGGIMLFDGASLKISNSTLNGNEAACGGGIGALLKNTIEISSTNIRNNRAVERDTPAAGSETIYHKGCGGGIGYQSCNTGSVLNVVNGEVSDNTAAHSGGGVFLNGGTSECVLDGVSVTGNTAAQGGGGYAGAITMRSGVTVTGNKVTGTDAASGAGFCVYEKLTLGKEGAAEETTTIENNTTTEASPKNSNLCLHHIRSTATTPARNNEENIELLCLFTGKIWVSNPGDAYTQFGIAGARAYLPDQGDMDRDPAAQIVEDARIAADDESELIGRMDWNDTNSTKVYWWRRPVAKITDAGGNLLYYYNGLELLPAVYTMLCVPTYDPYTAPTDITSAFSTLNNAYPGLVYADGSAYTATDADGDVVYYVKMLDDYILRNQMFLNTVKKKIIFTTASTSEADGYSYRGEHSYAKIDRGRSIETSTEANNPYFMRLLGSTNVTLTNITMDGGADRGIVVPIDGPFVNLFGQAILTIEAGTTLQNSRANDSNGWGGGAICHGYGSAGTTVIMNGGEIRDCYVNNNGGAISTCSGGSSTTIINGGKITNCSSGLKGGAIYMANVNSKLIINGGTIENCTSPKGGGIYLDEDAKMQLSGTPSFSANYSTSPTLASTVNGSDAAAYPGGKARTDIFAAQMSGSPAKAITLTGDVWFDTSTNELTEDKAGSIWVWCDNDRYRYGDQFAVVAEGAAVREESFKVFRNARDDKTTKNNSESYLTGNPGAKIDGRVCVYWGPVEDGFDVSFLKFDGFGEPLSGAEFTLYNNFAYDGTAKTITLSDAADRTAVSSDGNTRDPNDPGKKLATGTVLFEKVPAGVYYMKETAAPTGFELSDKVYIVLVGGTTLDGVKEDPRQGVWAENGILSGITETILNTQIEIQGETETRVYAIFLIDRETGKAVSTPDIAKYGVMNLLTATRKVILRKTGKTYAPLSGATFEILRADRSPVKSRDAGGAETTSFTSGSSGVYFIDSLPYGVYYLKETALNGTTLDSPKWFYLIVDETGIFEKESPAGGYDSESAVEAAAKSKIQTILAARTGSGA